MSALIIVYQHKHVDMHVLNVPYKQFSYQHNLQFPEVFAKRAEQQLRVELMNNYKDKSTHKQGVLGKYPYMSCVS